MRPTAFTQEVSLPAEALDPPAFTMDEAQFRSFYDRTAGPLQGYLRRLSRNATLAEDLAQEAYLRLLQATTRESDESRLRAYLFRIATNLFHDTWRRRRRELALEQEKSREDAASGADARFLDLSRALDRLKPRQRAMLWLAYVEGFEHREIARILGIREKGIRVTLFRCRKKLAALLAQERKDEERDRG